MKRPIYLDYAATTPCDERVAEKMMAYLCFDGIFANPASRSHQYGWQAEEAVEEARNHIADLIDADPREIVFTSGATESDNLAIKGVAQFYGKNGKHIISSAIEHKAVLDTCQQLESEGFEVTYLKPDEKGLITPEQVKAALREDTLLISLMHVNNEIGTMTNIRSISMLARKNGVLFHIDAAQSAGKIPLSVKEVKADLISLSAHKMYGPKGIGALYVCRNPRIRIEAQIHGGGHERGMRSGTLATHQIVGFGEAARLAKLEMQQNYQHLQMLRDRFWQGLQALDGIQLNGDLEQRIASNLNISFAGVDGESLMMALKDLAVSSGSACTSADLEPSYVLTHLGLSEQAAHSSLRFSFGRYTTEQDIDYALEAITHALARLRGE